MGNNNITSTPNPYFALASTLLSNQLFVLSKKDPIPIVQNYQHPQFNVMYQAAEIYNRGFICGLNSSAGIPNKVFAQYFEALSRRDGKYKADGINFLLGLEAGKAAIKNPKWSKRNYFERDYKNGKIVLPTSNGPRQANIDDKSNPKIFISSGKETYETAFFRVLNKYREDNGLPSVKLNEALRFAAKNRALLVSNTPNGREVFRDHTDRRPGGSGKTVWEEMKESGQFIFPPGGSSFGEVMLAHTAAVEPGAESAAAERDFQSYLSSPPHKSLISDPALVSVGIASANSTVKDISQQVATSVIEFSSAPIAMKTPTTSLSKKIDQVNSMPTRSPYRSNNQPVLMYQPRR
jgi:uncharacterized protein YkwD